MFSIACFGQGIAVHGTQQVAIENLRLRPAASGSDSTAVVTALQTVIADAQVCCGDDSALGDTAFTSGPLSLKDVGNKIEGKHILSDGRAVTIVANYVAASSVSSDRIIATLLKRQPMLMEWNSRVYVLYGVIYEDTVTSDGVHYNIIHKLLLLNPQAGASPQVTFDRPKDDWSNVQGLLTVAVTKQ